MSFAEYLPFYKRNLKVALPIILSHLGGAFVNLADTVMVGQIGTIELAAVSLGSSVSVIGFMFGVCVMIGATPLIGYAHIQGKNHKASALFQNEFLLSILLSLFIIAIQYIVLNFLPYMGQDPAVVAAAHNYYLYIIASFLPFYIYSAFRQFLEGIGNTKVAMVITVAANLLNILLNWLLIFGYWGFPKMGIDGAGLATLISRICMPIMFLLIFRFRKTWWGYIQEFRVSHFSLKVVKDILRIGVPIGGHQLMEISAFAFSSIMVGWIGATTQAGHQITMNISHLVFMIILGISSATIIRVSHQYGSRNYPALHMAANASIHICLAINVLMGGAVILLRHQIPLLFSSDPAVIEIASVLLIMTGIFQVSDGLQAVNAGILRGLSDVQKPLKYAFISYICINIPLAYILAFPLGLGAIGIWMAFIIGLGVAAILLYRRARLQINRLLNGQELLK